MTIIIYITKLKYKCPNAWVYLVVLKSELTYWLERGQCRLAAIGRSTKGSFLRLKKKEKKGKFLFEEVIKWCSFEIVCYYALGTQQIIWTIGRLASILLEDLWTLNHISIGLCWDLRNNWGAVIIFEGAHCLLLPCWIRPIA